MSFRNQASSEMTSSAQPKRDAGELDPEEPELLDAFEADVCADEGPASANEMAPGPTSTSDAAACAPAVSDVQLVLWISAVCGRDEAALASLYDATLSKVYGLVLRIVRNGALAEEVVEDTYFQVWRQAPRFDSTRGAPMAWLLGMARSRAIDGLRREARFKHDTLDEDTNTAHRGDHRAGADDLLEVARGHADLHRALMLLQAQPRQLVSLAFFRGLSHEEIAEQTHLPLGTVKSQIRRALLALRQALGDRVLPAWASPQA